MPINTPNPEYKSNIDKWQRCRDANTGGDAILAGGEKYLPKIPGQSPQEYKYYQRRPCYFEMVSRTVQGLVGAVTRLPHTFRLPTQIEPMLQDSSKDGLTLNEVIRHLLGEVLLQGRAGVLVDFDVATDMPYLTTYACETITNWGPDWYVLQEDLLEADPADQFKLNQITQYRHLWLDNGSYTVTIYRKNARSEWAPVSQIVPLRRGKPLTEIPFSWATPVGSSPRICRPPMLGIVDLALQHMRVSADLHACLFYSSLPTLVIAGISEDKAIQVGSTAAILLPDVNAKVTYAEFSGAGAGALRQAIRDCEERAASLGASILISERERSAKTATEVNHQSSNSTAILSAVTNGVGDCILRSLKIAAFWAGAVDNAKVEVSLNSEFIPVRLDPQMVSSLVSAVQSGALSVESFQQALAEAGVIEEPKAAA
jgi:Domain of unknown function (DUF4055)